MKLSRYTPLTPALFAAILMVNACFAAPPTAQRGYQGPKQPDLSVAASREITLAVPVDASKVRLIPVLPEAETLQRNTPDVLDNFRTRELESSENGTVQVTTAVPVILEEYPYGPFKTRNNPRFGAQLAGQANAILPTAKYPTKQALDQRQETLLKIMSQAGVGIARDFFSYGTRRFIIEKTRGVYNFEGPDFLAQTALRYGIEPIGRLSLHHGDPRKEGKPDDPDAYLAYVRAVVERYDGDGDLGCRLTYPDCYTAGDGQNPAKTAADQAAWGHAHQILIWELLKEPAPGRRIRVGNEAGLTPEHAREILKETYAVIRSAAPAAKVFFAGMGPVSDRTWSEDSYYEEMVSNGGAGCFDIAGVDAFIRPPGEKISLYDHVLKSHGQTKPIWVAQTGVPDKTGFRARLGSGAGGDPDAQAVYLARVFTEAFAAGAEKVFWGDFMDNSQSGSGRTTIWDSTGLFETETWRLKPAYFTYKLMATALLDFTGVEQVQSQVYKFTFAGKSPVYVILP